MVGKVSMATEASASPIRPDGKIAEVSKPLPAPPGPPRLDCAWHAVRGVRPELPVATAAVHSCQADQDSLHISDGQLGRIGGLISRSFIAAFQFLLEWLADKTNRSRVLAIACAVWSAATMCCGRRGQLPAICHRVHDGRLRRSRRRSTLVLHHLRLLSARPSRQSAGLLQHRPAAGCSPGNRFWRFHRVSLSAGAMRLSFSARLVLFAVIGILFWCRSLLAEAWIGISDQAPTSKPGFRQTLAMFVSRPSLILTALACGANQFITYGLINFAVPFSHA